MNLDNFLANLPLVGNAFRKSYGFWRAHIAVANITHIVFGMGIALLIFTDFLGLAVTSLTFAALMHGVAYLKGR